MHEAFRLVGHLRADDIDERADVVAGARLLLRDFLRGDAVRSARDGVRDRLVTYADVRERECERALDPRLVLRRGRGGEVRVERLVQTLIAPVEARIER